MSGIQQNGSPRNWKQNFVAIRVHRSDAGPSSRVLAIGVVGFRSGQAAWHSRQLVRAPDSVDLTQPWVLGPLQRAQIDPKDLAAAPLFEDVLRGLLAGLQAPWVCHYLEHELQALARERAIAEERLGRSLASQVPRPDLLISTQQLARRFHPVVGDGLPQVCKHYRLPAPTGEIMQHAELTGRVLLCMMSKLPDSVEQMRTVVEKASGIRRNLIPTRRS